MSSDKQDVWSLIKDTHGSSTIKKSQAKVIEIKHWQSFIFLKTCMI